MSGFTIIHDFVHCSCNNIVAPVVEYVKVKDVSEREKKVNILTTVAWGVGVPQVAAHALDPVAGVGGATL